MTPRQCIAFSTQTVFCIHPSHPLGQDREIYRNQKPLVKMVIYSMITKKIQCKNCRESRSKGTCNIKLVDKIVKVSFVLTCQLLLRLSLPQFLEVYLLNIWGVLFRTKPLQPNLQRFHRKQNYCQVHWSRKETMKQQFKETKKKRKRSRHYEFKWTIQWWNMQSLHQDK